jgi:hypothetical protein
MPRVSPLTTNGLAGLTGKIILSLAIRTQTRGRTKKINDRTLELTIWNHGRVTGTGQIMVSADGKSRTVTSSGTTAKGKTFNNTAVFDKQ